jgi:hypothetical protein
VQAVITRATDNATKIARLLAFVESMAGTLAGAVAAKPEPVRLQAHQADELRIDAWPVDVPTTLRRSDGP